MTSYHDEIIFTKMTQDNQSYMNSSLVKTNCDNQVLPWLINFKTK